MPEFLKDPRITEAVTPEVLAFLEANQPPAGTTAEEEAGWWQGLAAALLTELAAIRDRG